MIVDQVMWWYGATARAAHYAAMCMLQTSGIDPQIPEAQNYSTEEICSFFHVDPDAVLEDS
jgi:hypothetical protein